MSAPDRRRLVDRDNGRVSIRRQCELLGIARSGLYRTLAAANDNDAVLMRPIGRASASLTSSTQTGPLGTAAVDMMDNARALPTCPQPQQQEQTFAMVG
jgi:putative transposase